jgi:hypothetical protein
MLSRFFSNLFVLVLVITVSMGSVQIMPMPCCEEAQKTEEMPCHGDNAEHQKKVEKCCLDAFCPKCFSPVPNLVSSANSSVSELNGQAFAFPDHFLCSHSIKAPERPPKVLV